MASVLQSQPLNYTAADVNYCFLLAVYLSWSRQKLGAIKLVVTLFTLLCNHSFGTSKEISSVYIFLSRTSLATVL